MKTIMKTYKILLGLIFFSWGVYAQTARDTMQAYASAGWKVYKQHRLSEAEKEWKTAIHYAPSDTVAYNLAENLLVQKRPGEALEYFKKAASLSKNKQLKAMAWHNIGNIYFNKKQYAQAVEAYKNALRNNPEDDETRYNYALAKKMLKKQKQNQRNKQKNKQQNKNQNNKQNQNDKNKQNKDQNKNQNKNQKNKSNQKNKNQQNKDNKNKQNKDQENKNQQNNNNQKQDNKNKQDKNNKEKKNKQDQGKDKQNKQQPNKPDQSQNQNQSGKEKSKQNGKPQRKSKLTPEETMRILQALKNKENQTLKKVKARKAKAVRIKQDKDW